MDKTENAKKAISVNKNKSGLELNPKLFELTSSDQVRLANLFGSIIKNNREQDEALKNKTKIGN